jgi:hypothetical protein
VAKDGKKKGKKAETKLPKEVGGVKVPKQLRKLGNKAVQAAGNPVVSEVVAGALLAAAAALRQGKDPKAGAGGAGAGGPAGADRSGGDEGIAQVKRQAARLSDSLKVLAIDIARRALDGIEEGNRAKRRPEPEAGAPGAAGKGPAEG